MTCCGFAAMRMRVKLSSAASMEKPNRSALCGNMGPTRVLVATKRTRLPCLPCDVPINVRAGKYIRAEDMHDAAREFLHRPQTVRSTPPVRAGRSFRVMTYNVHACVGMDGKLSPRRIARVIAQSGADIVALQELDVGRSRTNHDDQAHEIARYLEMEFEFHPAWQLEEEKYGDAILSRFPLQLVKAGELPFAHGGERGEERFG